MSRFELWSLDQSRVGTEMEPFYIQSLAESVVG